MKNYMLMFPEHLDYDGNAKDTKNVKNKGTGQKRQEKTSRAKAPRPQRKAIRLF